MVVHSAVRQSYIVQVEDVEAHRLDALIHFDEYCCVALASDAMSLIANPEITGFVVDIILPTEAPGDPDAHELVRKIRQRRPELPIIVFTWNARPFWSGVRAKSATYNCVTCRRQFSTGYALVAFWVPDMQDCAADCAAVALP